MTIQLNLDIHGELIIDNFAGGGGASTGIELALGRRVDIAINHDPEAVAMHTANHPETKHYCESVWEIDPREVTQGRPVGLVWLSPDCKHFSKAKGGHHALVSAFLAKHYTGVVGDAMTNPVPTVTSVDHNSLVTAQLVGCGGRAGQSRPRDAGEPMQTITAKGDTTIVTSNLVKMRGDNVGQANTDPLQTISAQGTHFAEVRAFLVKYYGADQDPRMDEPLHTVTTKDRYGLVTVAGEEYSIADIGLRMLAPRELYRAQGFPDSYIIGDNPEQGLTLTKSAQVRMCGNSVCPPVAAAIVRANLADMAIRRAA